MGISHSLHKYLLYTYYVKDTFKALGYQVNKTAMTSAFTDLISRFKTWPYTYHIKLSEDITRLDFLITEDYNVYLVKW